MLECRPLLQHGAALTQLARYPTVAPSDESSPHESTLTTSRPDDPPPLEFAALSRAGWGKVRNEDAIFLDGCVRQGSVRAAGTLPPGVARLFAVADGVGASPRPHIASRRLLQLLSNRIEDARRQPLYPLLQAIQVEFGRLGRRPYYRFMATTLVGARVEDHVISVFNAGDSRAYLLDRGYVAQLSHDHTELQDLLDAGALTTEQAQLAAGMLRGISSLFGADPGYDELLRVHEVRTKMGSGQNLLICSDGLSSFVPETEFAQLVDEDLAASAKRLYEASQRNGSYDDVSIVLLGRCRPRHRVDPAP